MYRIKFHFVELFFIQSALVIDISEYFIGKPSSYMFFCFTPTWFLLRPLTTQLRGQVVF